MFRKYTYVLEVEYMMSRKFVIYYLTTNKDEFDFSSILPYTHFHHHIHIKSIGDLVHFMYNIFPKMLRMGISGQYISWFISILLITCRGSNNNNYNTTTTIITTNKNNNIKMYIFLMQNT